MQRIEIDCTSGALAAIEMSEDEESAHRAQQEQATRAQQEHAAAAEEAARQRRAALATIVGHPAFAEHPDLCAALESVLARD